MTVAEEHMEDPFSQTRLGNNTNPFVDNAFLDVSTHEDSDDEQEFNERYVHAITQSLSTPSSSLLTSYYMLILYLAGYQG